jgi:hypothetical protein
MRVFTGTFRLVDNEATKTDSIESVKQAFEDDLIGDSGYSIKATTSNWEEVDVTVEDRKLLFGDDVDLDEVDPDVADKDV